MSQITIFSKSAAKIGDYSMDDDAIALVNCDDVYDKKFLDVKSRKQLAEVEKKSNKWKYFSEINSLNQEA